ncbi:MAG: hypothetical protein OT477_13915 [Chloroflexi bacterium]|nr:hypothetical protein [Chloroflexota bacterium]
MMLQINSTQNIIIRNRAAAPFAGLPSRIAPMAQNVCSMFF